MKKIKVIAFLTIGLLLSLTSCEKNAENVNSEYAVELKTIRTQPNNEEVNISLDITNKIIDKLLNFFRISDDPVKTRQKAVMKNYKSNNEIKIGIASSWEQNKTDAHNAIMLALKEVNEKGGVAGAEIVLVEGDDQADVNMGTRVAYKMAEDKEIFAVIGHAYSDITTPASLIYSYYGMPVFSPMSNSHSLTRQKDSMIFRNINSDFEYGREAANFCSFKGWRNVAVIYADGSFGENIANQFELECGTTDVSVVTRDSFLLNQTDSEYKKLFKKWKNNYRFDSIFVVGNQPQIGRIVELLREAEITQPIIGSDSFDDPRLEKIYKETEVGNIYAVTCYNNNSKNPAYFDFVRKFKAAYGHEPDQEGVQWYDAFKVLVKAIEKAEKPDCTAVVKELRNGFWTEAAGPYVFDSYGNISGRALVVKEMTEEGYVIVY